MTTSLILPSLLLTLLLAPLASADENNILLTGDVLATDGQLTYLSATFVMQNDCNLVLYNKGSGFVSGTSGQGTSCTLTLDDHGQLTIYNAGTSSSPIWTAPLSTNTKKGNYAAVLGPDGQVTVYGPALWSTPPRNSNADTSDDDRNGAEQANIPMVRNVLFSSQILYNNAQLATRDYTFVMQNDCNLVLNKASNQEIVWQSGTSGKGQNCFARLGHQGQLAVENDRYKTLWSSKPVGKEGDYVLILQINGQAVVYGPAVWSTSSS